MTDYPEAFLRSLDFTAKWEGGWANVKGDPGGKTKFGIADLRDGVADGKTDSDGDGKADTVIADLTFEQAKDIYYREYWLESACNLYPIPMDMCVFDAAVHSGPKRALAWLEESKGSFIAYNNLREVFLRQWVNQKLEERNKFLKGLLARINDLRFECGQLTKKRL